MATLSSPPTCASSPSSYVSRFLLAMAALSLLPTCASLRCPSSCGFISRVPYPFGAAPGCGAPGFQISNCSATPRWNLVLSETTHFYYVSSIHPPANSRNPSLGYGGFVILSLLPSADTPMCRIASPLFNMTEFSTLNLYAFESANLTLSEDRYLFFNCTEPVTQKPSSGVLTVSSPACRNYVHYCNHSSVGSCLEYVPFKDLYLPWLLSSYSCSAFRRFIIAHDDDPVETWITGVKITWGPVQDVDSCTKCQDTGGTCGYDTEDNSFLCYCGDDGDANLVDCNRQSKGNMKVIVATSVTSAGVLILAGIAFCLVYKHYYWWFCGKHKLLKLERVRQAPIDFPYGALVATTRNFSTEIGRGAFGKVYRGLLPDGNEVAVKVLDASMSHSNDQFLNEVASIGSIHHLNIARLFGFCFTKSKRILVYEYVSNGSLDKHLFCSSAHASKAVLSWKQRFDIALGIAQGLCYMHDECRNCIVHCDIKPQNILLDAAYRPKIADFGLAKLLSREESRVLTQARGTPGYVAPEFWSLGSGPLSAKFDVYSYGVMLLEILRGKRSFHQCDPFSLEEPDELDNWMSVSVDRKIMGDADLEQAKVCTLVALWCIQEDPSMRPTMGKVIQYLQGTAEVPADVPTPCKKMYTD